jgi:ATP-dependent RNA helicase RhlE
MVFGGVSEKPQIKALYGGLDILVATVGRLLDLKQQGHIDISQVDTFILDEADRMLDMGFIRDIQKIAAAIPQQRHTLLFSATMAPEITKLAKGLLHSPREIRIAPQGTTAEKIDQHVLFVKKADKQNLLLDLIQEHQEKSKNNELSLVFSRTKHGAKNLARKLCSAGIEADSLHGNKSQNARQKTLDLYKKGEVRVLVATDVAARGIDVKNITLVINFDLPMESDAYVHRIGRTARAGESGKALSFCSEDEVALLREVEKLIKRKVPIYDHDYHAAHIEHHHTSGAPAQKPKQGGGGNRGPRHGGGNRSGGQGGRGRRRPQGGGKSSSGNPKPKNDSRPTGGFQKGAGQRSNRSRGRKH